MAKELCKEQQKRSKRSSKDKRESRVKRTPSKMLREVVAEKKYKVAVKYSLCILGFLVYCYLYAKGMNSKPAMGTLNSINGLKGYHIKGSSATKPTGTSITPISITTVNGLKCYEGTYTESYTTEYKTEHFKRTKQHHKVRKDNYRCKKELCNRGAVLAKGSVGIVSLLIIKSFADHSQPLA